MVTIKITGRCTTYNIHVLYSDCVHYWLLVQHDLERCDRQGQDDYRFVYIGPAGSWTQMHHDVLNRCPSNNVWLGALPKWVHTLWSVGTGGLGILLWSYGSTLINANLFSGTRTHCSNVFFFFKHATPIRAPATISGRLQVCTCLGSICVRFRSPREMAMSLGRRSIYLVRRWLHNLSLGRKSHPFFVWIGYRKETTSRMVHTAVEIRYLKRLQGFGSGGAIP